MNNLKFFGAVLLIALMQVSVASAMDFNGCTVEEVVMGSVPENGHIRLSCVVAPRTVCATVDTWVGHSRAMTS